MVDIADRSAPPTEAERISTAAADKMRNDATGETVVELKKEMTDSASKNLPDLTIEMDELKKGEHDPAKDGDGGGKKNFESPRTEQNPGLELERNQPLEVEPGLKVAPVPEFTPGAAPGTESIPALRPMTGGIAP